jgi:hypothetical protein
LQRSAPQRRPWRGDNWSKWIGIIIEGRLRPHRERIAELLSIDPNDKEWQNEPAAMPDDPELSPGERYLRWRGTPPPGGGFVSRLDLAIEDITGELRRCWAIFRNVNRAGSPAAAYRTLEELEADSRDHVSRLEEASPYVQVLVAGKCPGGWLALENDEVDPDQLRAAISKAKSALLRPARGRPKGTRDFASQHLAQALADIYLRHSVKRPTRRRLSLADEPHEYGPYKDFVELIVSIIPVRLRSSKKGGLKGVDHLVRIGVEHIRDRAASST